ncbi:MAG: hypothetical protein GF368_04210 [Candidatus Aenigmarchaeota archaeon]|nr:hypothetical protein [Candidatus Aenigmarchaeota archaeon]
MGFLENLKEKLDLRKIQKSLEKPKLKSKSKIIGPQEELKLKVGATSGIYSAARSPELADIISKLSYTLTRGATCLELASDVPHEVNYTQGKELRHISKKQGVDITFHGALSVQMGIPELIEWSSAQEHMQKSIKSAVHAGAKYIDFHSCLREWLELFTYAGSRLHIIMSDWDGNFIGEIFKNNPKLSKWFSYDSRYRFWSAFGGVIVGPELNLQLETAMDNKMNNIIEESEGAIKDRFLIRFRNSIFRDIGSLVQISRELLDEGIIDRGLFNGIVSGDPDSIQRIREILTNEKIKSLSLFKDEFNDHMNELKRLPYHSKIGELTRMAVFGPDTDKEIRQRIEKERERTIKELVEDKLHKTGDWFEKERTGATLEMAYYILAHELYINKYKYPIWDQMVKLYWNELNRLGYKEYDASIEGLSNNKRLNWLEKTIITIEEQEDKELVKTFKEFYYGVVAIKFLQGHIERLVKWMEEDLPDILKEEVKLTEPSPNRVEEQRDELIQSLKQLAIAIENPDARDPSQGGRFLLWRPKQIYLAIRNIRSSLKEKKRSHWDKVLMLIDFEHLATQGVDPLEELKEMVSNKLTKNYAEIVKAVHAGVPTPLHSHKPIGAEDREIVYRLLWELKKAGLGRKIETYLIFERGGFKDPFKGSVKALKDMKKLLEENVEPSKLPGWFFEIPHPKYQARQRAIIFEHTFDPIKGLLKFPEEEYTLLGSAALKAGKRPEEWKKEELR